MSKPFTIQVLRHSLREGHCYALRDQANHCAAIVGEVDAALDGEPTERHTRMFAAAPNSLHWLKQCEHYFRSRQLLGAELSTGESWLFDHISAAIMDAEHAPLPTE